jgi:antitoxin VapB
VKRGSSEFEQSKTGALALEENGRPIIGSVATQAERRVKLFKNGRSQAVRIPREFELPGKEAIMRKEGERLIIEPGKPKSLLAVLATLEPLDEELPPNADQVPEPVDL